MTSAHKPFTEQLRDAADHVDTLTKTEISSLLRRAAIRLDERDRMLKVARDCLVEVLEKLPQEGNA